MLLLEKNDIKNKLRYEKFYKLDNNVFMLRHFAFEIDAILSTDISIVIKDKTNDKFVFLLTSCLDHLYK